MNESRSWFRLGLFGIAVAYIYGAILGGAELAWQGLLKHRLPDWEWWQYALAPLAIGLVAAGLEVLGEYLNNSFTLQSPVPYKWRRYLGGITLVLFLILLVLGPALYTIRKG